MGEVGKSDNEFYCRKCGERFQDFLEVIPHDCPKKETEPQRLLDMFEVFDLLQSNESFENKAETFVNENPSDNATSKTSSSFCKFVKVGSLRSFTKELKISQSSQGLPSENCHLKPQSGNEWVKPLSLAVPNESSPSAKISEDIAPSCSMKHISEKISKCSLDCKMDPQDEYSMKETGKANTKSLSNELIEGSSPLNKMSKQYLKCSINLDMVNLSRPSHGSNPPMKKTSLQTNWGKLRFAKSSKMTLQKISSASSESKDDFESDSNK